MNRNDQGIMTYSTTFLATLLAQTMPGVPLTYAKRNTKSSGSMKPMMQRLIMLSLRHSLMLRRVSTAAGGRHWLAAGGTELGWDTRKNMKGRWSFLLTVSCCQATLAESVGMTCGSISELAELCEVCTEVGRVGGAGSRTGRAAPGGWRWTWVM